MHNACLKCPLQADRFSQRRRVLCSIRLDYTADKLDNITRCRRLQRAVRLSIIIPSDLPCRVLVAMYNNQRSLPSVDHTGYLSGQCIAARCIIFLPCQRICRRTSLNHKPGSVIVRYEPAFLIDGVLRALAHIQPCFSILHPYMSSDVLHSCPLGRRKTDQYILILRSIAGGAFTSLLHRHFQLTCRCRTGHVVVCIPGFAIRCPNRQYRRLHHHETHSQKPRQTPLHVSHILSSRLFHARQYDTATCHAVSWSHLVIIQDCA